MPRYADWEFKIRTQKFYWFDLATEATVDLCTHNGMDTDEFIPVKKAKFGPLLVNIPQRPWEEKVHKAWWGMMEKGIDTKNESIQFHFDRDRSKVDGTKRFTCDFYTCGARTETITNQGSRALIPQQSCWGSFSLSRSQFLYINTSNNNY